MVEGQAPGKLLLTGEYAVLRGAPAVAQAMGGPARARVSRAVAGEFRDAQAGQSWPYSLGQGAGVHWHAGDPGQAGRLPTAVLAECLRRWPTPLQTQPLILELDTSAFRHLDADGAALKFGLGSSAALVVALVGAVVAELDIEVSPAQLRDCCLDAHRAFQGGQGSGVDVLTALQGGLLLMAGAGAPPASLAWPGDLHRVTVWTGRSASTPALIAQFDAFARRQPEKFADCLAQLVTAAGDAAGAWRAGVASQIIVAVQCYAQALRVLDAQGDIGIWTPEHEILAGLSASHGAVYKSSGAGGGDLGFALSESADAAAALTQAMTSAGFHVLPGQAQTLAGLAVTADA
ncbi:MAG: mevalonate kinase family protein [Gammaproteobacteria bacterium]